MKKIIGAALAAVLVTSSVPALAGEMYWAASVGQSKMDSSKSSLDNELVAAGATGLASSLDDTDTAYKVQFGYQLNNNVAIEGGYIDFGKTKYKAVANEGTATAEGEGSGWIISAVGMAPINDTVSLFGKIGAIDATVKVKAAVAVPALGTFSGSAKSSDWRGTYGIGASYRFSRDISVRAEYEHFNNLGSSDTGKEDVNLFTIGIVFASY